MNDNEDEVAVGYNGRMNHNEDEVAVGYNGRFTYYRIDVK